MLDARPGVDIGLTALPHLGLASLGVLGHALAHCVTLRDALGAFIRYQRLLTDATTWRVRGDTLKVDPHPTLSALGHPVTNMLGLWLVLSRRITGVEWTPRAVWFRHPPLGDPATAEAFFGVMPHFGADRDGLDMGDALALPVHGARDDVRRAALTLLDARLPDDAPTGVIAEVRAVLRSQILEGGGDQTTVARALGVSPRTLARRLSAEGTGFRALLDDARAELARHWLADPTLAIYEVAFLLGYGEASAFHRAFKRWTGESPSTWREAPSVSRSTPTARMPFRVK